jgi:hypothetical protein
MAAVKQTLKSNRVHCKQLLLPVISNQNQSRQMTDENNEEDRNENHSSLTSIIDQGRDVTPSYETIRVIRFETDEPSTIRGNGAPSLFSLLTPDICTELWYQPSELAGFRVDIRNILKSGGPENDAVFSGDLERCSRDRLISKRRAIQFVLGAQKLQKGAEFLGMVSRRCSSWVCDIALTQGYLNFCEVNDPLPATNYHHTGVFFGDHCIKRKQISLLDKPLSGICEERRLRRRTTVGKSA